MGGKISPQPGNLFDQSGGNIRIFQLRCQKDGFASFEELTVHQCHLQFIFKVGKGTQSPENGIGFQLFDGVDQQSFKCDDLHIGHIGAAFNDELPSFLKSKERIFAGVDRNCHHHFVKKTPGTLDQIEMSIGERIERSRIYYRFHSVSPLTEL